MNLTINKIMVLGCAFIVMLMGIALFTQLMQGSKNLDLTIRRARASYNHDGITRVILRDKSGHHIIVSEYEPQKVSGYTYIMSIPRQ